MSNKTVKSAEELLREAQHAAAYKIVREDREEEKRGKRLKTVDANWWQTNLTYLLGNGKVEYTSVTTGENRRPDTNRRQRLTPEGVDGNIAISVSDYDGFATLFIHDTYGLHFWNCEIYIPERSYTVCCDMFNGYLERMQCLIIPNEKQIDEEAWDMAQRQWWRGPHARIQDIGAYLTTKRAMRRDDKLLRRMEEDTEV